MRTMKAEEFLINNAMICQIADGGGNDMVTLDDAKKAIDIAHNEAVKKWSLWCFNYRTPFLIELTHTLHVCVRKTLQSRLLLLQLIGDDLQCICAIFCLTAKR